MGDPLADRGALAELLVARGVGEDAGRLAEAAATALQLVRAPEAGPAPGSRLGGPALVPPGTTWPRDGRGRPLSFLAALDLAELEAFDDRELLPGDGWLLFFADIDNHDAEGLVDEAPNEEGEVARVFFVADPVPGEEPDDLVVDANNVLRRRPVAFRRALTLPDDFEAAARLGVAEDAHDAAVAALCELYEQVPWSRDTEGLEEDESDTEEDLGAWMGPQDTPRTEADLVRRGWRPRDDGRSLGGVHWVGGLASGVQGHPPEEDTLLLLHLSWDEPLGFLFLDGGGVQFRIPRAAAAARDWSQAVAMATPADRPAPSLVRVPEELGEADVGVGPRPPHDHEHLDLVVRADLPVLAGQRERLAEHRVEGIASELARLVLRRRPDHDVDADVLGMAVRSRSRPDDVRQRLQAGDQARHVLHGRVPHLVGPLGRRVMTRHLQREPATLAPSPALGGGQHLVRRRPVREPVCPKSSCRELLAADDPYDHVV